MWNDFGRSLFQTRVFPALLSFFILSDNFFDSRPIFGSIGFLDPELYAESLKKIIKKIEYSRNLSEPENYWCGQQQPYHFFPISGHFRIDQENQNRLIRSEKIAVTGGKKFLDNLKRKDFCSRSKKIFMLLITAVPVYVYSTILVITKIYLSVLLYFTSVLLLIMRSQPASIATTVASTAAFYHCWSYTKHSDLWIRCVVYILY